LGAFISIESSGRGEMPCKTTVITLRIGFAPSEQRWHGDCHSNSRERKRSSPQTSNTRGLVMSLPNKDEMEGKFDQAKGKVKETAGRTMNDRELENEGNADRAKGNVQETYGKGKRQVGDAVKDLGDKIRE
jgi:uncharacterized protein YjbJ (UPF0337 family)